MLNNVNDLKNYKLNSLDGELGKTKELYFDDRYWTIRYLVADTGSWFSQNLVLISPYALKNVNKDEENITIDLTKKQIEESPSADKHMPVSRQFEEKYHAYYGFPMYWTAQNVWGTYQNIERDSKKWTKSSGNEQSWESHLSSTHDVIGFDIQAIDGEVGHVLDFIIDDETWQIRYLIIDTGDWWPAKKVLISPKWIERVSWDESKIFVNLTCVSIQESPAFTDKTVLTRGYETILHQHYNRQGYWFGEVDAKKVPLER
jgi:uncharacterized protein YrrD